MNGVDDTTFEAAWNSLQEDAAVIADDLREDNWEAHLLSPGDVTAVVDGERPFGLSVLVPTSEFELVQEATADGSFDQSDIYRKTTGPLVLLLIVERSEQTDTAVLIPAYYNRASNSEFLEQADQRDEIPVHVRALGREQTVTFSHGQSSLFLPPEEDQ